MAITIKDNDKAFKKLEKVIAAMASRSAVVGLFGEGDASENLAERGAVHEFGTRNGNIPSRPFMRQGFDNNVEALSKLGDALFRMMLKGKKAPSDILKILSEKMVAYLKESITSGGKPSFKPLKPETIRRKGSSAPLIDVGNMVGSITYKIRKDKKEKVNG